jgi:hypothetical protein
LEGTRHLDEGFCALSCIEGFYALSCIEGFYAFLCIEGFYALSWLNLYANLCESCQPFLPTFVNLYANLCVSRQPLCIELAESA